MADSIRNHKVLRYNQGEITEEQDLLVREEPLEIRLGYGRGEFREQKSLSVTMRTPGDDFNLAIGFLFTEGIIEDYTSIESIHYCETVKSGEKGNVLRVELKEEVNIEWNKISRNFYTTSSCGVCGKASIEAVTVQSRPIPKDHIEIAPEILLKISEELSGKQTVFKYTGALHAAALYSLEGDLHLIAEDIGRHNALDKLIGKLVTEQQVPLRKSILLLSGRAGFELIQKSARAGIPIIASVGAPSTLSAELAATLNITLVGFLKDQRFNIYTGELRVSV